MTGARAPRPLLWGIVLLAAVAVSLFAVRDDRAGRGAAGHDGEAVEFLVPVPPDGMAAVELLRAGRLTRFERAADGAWFLHADAQGHAHAGTPEAAERIAQAFAMFSRARVERRIDVAGEERRRFGLLFPDLVVAVYVAGRAQPAFSLEVGDVAPDGLSRYALVSGSDVVVTIPNYHVSNLTALLAGKG